MAGKKGIAATVNAAGEAIVPDAKTAHGLPWALWLGAGPVAEIDFLIFGANPWAAAGNVCPDTSWPNPLTFSWPTRADSPEGVTGHGCRRGLNATGGRKKQRRHQYNDSRRKTTPTRPRR